MVTCCSSLSTELIYVGGVHKVPGNLLEQNNILQIILLSKGFSMFMSKELWVLHQVPNLMVLQNYLHKFLDSCTSTESELMRPGLGIFVFSNVPQRFESGSQQCLNTTEFVHFLIFGYKCGNKWCVSRPLPVSFVGQVVRPTIYWACTMCQASYWVPNVY